MLSTPHTVFAPCKKLTSIQINLTLSLCQGSKRNSIELIHLLILPSYPLPPWLLEANYPSLITNMLLREPSHTLPTSTVSSAFVSSTCSCI